MLIKVVCMGIFVLEESFRFSPLSIILAVDLSCGLYYVEVHSLCTHFFESFYQKWMLDFVNYFSVSLEMIT